MGCVPSAISPTFMLEHHRCIFLKSETIFLNEPDGKDRHHFNDHDITGDIGIRPFGDEYIGSNTERYGDGETNQLPDGKTKDYFLFVLSNFFRDPYFYGHPVAPFYTRY